MLALSAAKEDARARKRWPAFKDDLLEASAARFQAHDVLGANVDSSGGQAARVSRRDDSGGVCADDKIARPGEQRQRQPGCGTRRADHRQGLVAIFPAIAIRAVMDALAIELAQAGNVGKQ